MSCQEIKKRLIDSQLAVENKRCVYDVSYIDQKNILNRLGE